MSTNMAYCVGQKRNVSTVRYLFQSQTSALPNLKSSFLNNRVEIASSLYRKDLYGHFGCVNAIEFSNGSGSLLCSGGDDRRVLLWNMEKAITGKACADVMKGEHNSNIFCLTFDNSNSKVYSAGNDEQVVVHDVATRETLDVFLHEEAVYSLSVDPVNENVFASACEDGRILIWDIREPSSTEPFMLAGYVSAFHAVMYNPLDPRLIGSANSKEGVALWDIRKPRSCIMRYGGAFVQQSAMSIRFNSTGRHIFALRRKMCPVLYEISCAEALYEFDHPSYYNSCTMKSCCFAGDNDQYVLSGSDDFGLYVWKVPEQGANVKHVKQAALVLEDHRSIVNQVRSNPSNFLIASSGVEKIIKLWCPMHIPGGTGNLNNELPNFSDRDIYSHEQYINLVLRSGQVMSHDYTHGSETEDPRMMAFFDSLVQREVEGSSSVDSDSNSTAIPSGSSDDERTHPQVASGEERLSSTGNFYSTVAVVSLDARLLSNSHSATANNSSGKKRSGLKTISEMIKKKRIHSSSKNVKHHKKALLLSEKEMAIKKRRLRRFRFSDESSNSDDDFRVVLQTRGAFDAPTDTNGRNSTSDRQGTSGLSASDVASVLTSQLRNQKSAREKQKHLIKARARILQDLSDSDEERPNVIESADAWSSTCLPQNDELRTNEENTGPCSCYFCETVGPNISSCLKKPSQVNGTSKAALSVETKSDEKRTSSYDNVTAGIKENGDDSAANNKGVNGCTESLEFISRNGRHKCRDEGDSLNEQVTTERSCDVIDSLSKPDSSDKNIGAINAGDFSVSSSCAVDGVSSDIPTCSAQSFTHSSEIANSGSQINGSAVTEARADETGTTWLEFRRFRNRLERARRKYRHRNSSDELRDPGDF